MNAEAQTAATLTLTIFRDVGARRAEEQEWSFEELTERLRKANTYADKASCPLIKLARFGDQRTEKGSLRHDGNVLEIHGVEADYDGEKVSTAEAQMMLHEHNISAILYTSPSHKEERPRWRVLCPTSKPCPPADRVRLVARLNGALGGILAPESFVLSQSYYAGRVNGAPYEVSQVRGECIDLLPVLDAKAIQPAKNGESRAQRLEKIRSTDPVIAKLNERGMVLTPRHDGGADIICPFEADHTSKRSPADCSYWPPNTGGFELGHFKCLHGHCAGRSDDDFLRAIGLSVGESTDAEVAGEVDAWSEPKPLQREPSQPTLFPVEALGDVLGAAAVEITNVIQAPLAISGNSVLAAAHLAAQGHVNVLIDGRRHPISEFFLTIGRTGERKSAVDKIALQPHRERQDELRATHKREFAEHERQADAYKKSKEEAIGGTKSKGYEAKVKALRELGDPPADPLEPFLLCEEPTYEGLVKMLAHGQPSIGLFSDEGGRFIGGHGMSEDHMLKTAAGLSGMWDGNPISRVRAGDGAALLPGRRVSAHLMAQPDIAQLMLSNFVLLEQGLLSRCLVTWPDSTAGCRLYKAVDLSDMDTIKRYSAVMMKLLVAPLTLKEGALNELAPRDLSLDHEAKRIWIAYHDAIERELVDTGKLAQIRGLANKAPEHASRIAAVLALVDDLGCSAISARWMKSGIALVTHYLNEAMRLYEAGAADPEIREAEKLLTWLKSRPADRRTVISLVEVYQLGPNSIRNAKTARALMKLLEEHGYVRPTLDPDNRRKEVWSVRP